ncbi:MAG: YHS domain-containing protein [Candidatus Omnitrophota bacterium]
MKLSAMILSGMLLVAAGPVMAQADEAQMAVKAVNVGNKLCPVSGEKVSADSGMAPVTYEYKGKVYNLCCGGCIAKFAAEPEKYSKIAEEEVIKTSGGE